MRFKIDDIVIGNIKANKYSITKQGFIGIVKRNFIINNVEFIDIIENKTTSNNKEIEIYSVMAKCFDLFQKKHLIDIRELNKTLYDFKKK